MTASKIAIVGLPTDDHSSHLRGASEAPALIRAEMFSEQGNPYTELGVDLRAEGLLVDAGDAAITADADVERIESFVAARLAEGFKVLSLGGDHFVTYPIMRAYAKAYNALHIVHFDAHPDLYESFQGDRHSHASPFARIMEDGLAASLLQIGIRTMSPPQKRQVEKYGVRVFAPWELTAACAALPSGNVYVSLDLDGLDPAFAPGVSHREPGGLSVRDVLEVVKAIPGTLVGADVVEYNPRQDIGTVTASVAAKFAREFMGRMATDG